MKNIGNKRTSWFAIASNDATNDNNETTQQETTAERATTDQTPLKPIEALFFLLRDLRRF